MFKHRSFHVLILSSAQFLKIIILNLFFFQDRFLRDKQAQSSNIYYYFVIIEIIILIFF